MALDLSAYAVDLDTPRPDGKQGDSPRGAFTKVNGAWQTIQDYINSNTGVIGPEPADTFPYMLWLDTGVSPALLKRRNVADDAWVTLGDPFFNPEAADTNLQIGFKNKIINGNFEIWQRGQTQSTGGYGSADRWQASATGTTFTSWVLNFPVGQTAVPGNPTYYYNITVNSVPGASNFCVVQQPIENVRTAQGQTVTISFWAKADANKPMAVELAQIFGTGGTPSATVLGIGAQQVNLTTSWQKHTVTIAVPSITGKTFGTDGNNKLTLIFWFDSGSSYDSRNGSLGQRSGVYDISRVQFEIGSKATEFEDRHTAQEFELCQRYLRAFGGDSTSPVLAWGQCTGTNSAAVQVQLGNMRGVPSFSTSGSFILLNSAGSPVAVTSIAIGPGGTNRKIARIGVGTASGLVAGDCTVLCGADANARMYLDAEI